MKKILLIDDEAPLRSVFAIALRRAGYHVLEADSGQTGFELARQHLPDLILSDIHMPGGDGSTLLKDIRRDPALSSKQVVLMTGRPDLITPRRAMEEGADDFLVKPVSVQALLNCMAARFARASISWRVEDELLARLKSSVPRQLPHEFFTPLAGIIGLMEVVRGDSSQFSTEELSGIHGDVYDSALRLHRTLRNYLLLLDLQETSAEKGKERPLSPDIVKTALNAGIEEALRLNNRVDDITVSGADVTLAIAEGDLTRLVEELVDNACKYSRPGTPVEIELTRDGTLTVTDQGRGMSAEEIDQIGAFQQFDRKKQEQQGLGLGLVLVQRLTALYRADFSMNSKPGEGTRVRVAFPKAAI